MGKRRSKLTDSIQKQRRSYKTRRAKRVKTPKDLECPWCNGTRMFIERQGSFWLVGCHDCNQGELLPFHPTWKPIDMYNFVCDNFHDDTKVPIFKYESMTLRMYERLKEHVTLGRIAVREIILPKGHDET